MASGIATSSNVKTLSHSFSRQLHRGPRTSSASDTHQITRVTLAARQLILPIPITTAEVYGRDFGAIHINCKAPFKPFDITPKSCPSATAPIPLKFQLSTDHLKRRHQLRHFKVFVSIERHHFFTVANAESAEAATEHLHGLGLGLVISNEIPFSSIICTKFLSRPNLRFNRCPMSNSRSMSAMN